MSQMDPAVFRSMSPSQLAHVPPLIPLWPAPGIEACPEHHVWPHNDLECPCKEVEVNIDVAGTLLMG